MERLFQWPTFLGNMVALGYVVQESSLCLKNIIHPPNAQEKQADLSSKMKHNVSTPEGVPRLFDLVKVQDERMKLAFYAALGNTVVAKDLDQVNSSFIVYALSFF